MKKAHFPSPPLSLQTRGRGHQSSLYGGSDGKECACSVGEPGLIPGLGRLPRRREWQPTPVFLSGEFHEQRSLVGYSPWRRRVGHD